MKFIRSILMIVAVVLLSVVLYNFFGWLTSYIMGSGWILLLLMFFFTTFFASVISLLPMLLDMAIIFISNGSLNVFEKIILSILLVPTYIEILIKPWIFDIDYSLVKIFLALNLNFYVFSLFATTMYAIWSLDGKDDEK